ncbi:morn repeat protein [Salpingoeca rosetta]|uniref:Morn repeat protein n=1 Tax=Salpingoeca rosetta (strain ATCC 50818 / BSB-021) TaxID=946362 RepID=F2TYJ6_SALR5|nr:morn repeat protein [Salpingoeca rosetta]EGD78670.1 morn repeat protein [Salpingoeca rosetta]|eukprot:XP_004997627.1 morn repeat protein [Salpingoeca rosetta]
MKVTDTQTQGPAMERAVPSCQMAIRTRVTTSMGVYQFKNGARYEGAYVQNKKDGEGTFYFPDGSKYEGQFKADLRHGFGTYTYPNGDTYEGEWEEGLRHGQGTYTYAESGAKYIGTWSRGNRVGDGKLVYADMEFQGTFVDDQPLGPGKFVFNRGYEQAGEYVVADTSEEPEEDGQRNMRWVGQSLSALE